VNDVVTNRRDQFERARSCWKGKKGTWCALDFEAWEYEHTVLTEFGWRSVTWSEGEETYEAGHIIIPEHEKYRNGNWVADQRYDYDFGTSEKVKKGVFPDRVCDLLVKLKAHGPVFLVFHDHNQDVRYLQSDFIKAPLEGLSYMLPPNFPQDGLFVLDTGDLFAALEGDDSSNIRSLERVCGLLQIRTKHLHNAGNDAWFTLEALKLMVSGETVDVQREARWPNQTAPRTVKVEFGSDPESDFSDDEGFIRASDTYAVDEA